MSEDLTVAELAQDIARGDCVIFIGAGVSIPAGLPSGSALERSMRRRADLPEFNNLPRTAECCKANIGEKQFNALVSEEVLRAQHPTKIHRLLASLPVKLFVTTNYDTLLERALVNAHISPTVLSLDHTSEWLQITESPAKTYLLKMHGCITHPSKLIITESDYLTFSETYKELLHGLTTLIARRPVLFFGYSLSDWHLLSLLRVVSKMTQGSATNKYYLSFGGGLQTARFLEGCYSLKVIDPGSHPTKEDAARLFFEKLIDQFEVPQWFRRTLKEFGGNKNSVSIVRETRLSDLFSMFDVGMQMRVAIRIQKERKVQLPLDKALRAETVGELIDLVRASKRKPNGK